MAKASHLFLLHLLTPFIFLHFSHVTPTHVTLKHIDSEGSYSKTELITRAATRTALRHASIRSTLATSPTLNGQSPVMFFGSGYVMNLSVGTPPVQLESIMDTGSDLIWTQCQPCINCFNQDMPIFNPGNSTSFSELSCSHPLCTYLDHYTNTSCVSSKCQYTYRYGDGSYTTGALSKETFTFGSSDDRSVSVSVPNMAFGCSRDTTSDFANTSGIIGLSMGNLSLVRYLDSPRFSYCLTPFYEESSSSLILGSASCINPNNKNVTSTPIMINPAQPMFYYMKLNGISMNGDLLSIPTNSFDIKADGTGGTIIDSGSTFTGLTSVAYQAVRQKVKSLVKLLVSPVTIDPSIDLCFISLSKSIPKNLPDMILHFEGGDLVIPKENYMVIVPDSRLLCLGMMDSSSESILGAYQQQNMHILYDSGNKMISFEPAQCAKGGNFNCKGTKSPAGSGSFRSSPSLIFSIVIALIALLCT